MKQTARKSEMQRQRLLAEICLAVGLVLAAMAVALLI
jgi:uncharacterized membrane protein